MEKQQDPQFEALSKEAKALYERLREEWHITDGGGLAVLMVAAQALDRMRQAQAILAKEGVIARDRFGQPKAHPGTQVEKEAGARFLQAMKALNLDLESLEEEK